MRIKSQKDFWAGVLYVVVGGGFALGAPSYTIGTAARMGPGYFPLVVGILLAMLGLVIVLRALVIQTPDGEPVGPWAWRPLVFIILANFLFGILLGGVPALGIPPMGVIVAIVALTLVSALAGSEFRLREVALLAAVLAIGSWAVFVRGLNLQLQVWPGFIAG
ncbi:MAG TPA: tripartite tricarboxylate transporter TctB family protein [Ottowia sp.]|uniref:tripartite tricarboxylate transporter TctB family protein n=1 Tax=Ottowia sp. TaxID=1898956 RepID=UPI002BA298C9|nr:tripartite tricarboxylate transporter TctB family protein [Ottowia sp.]HMN22384.1 tripartite tricarboxylate transporter TctB family protein [Ottowia sp.]